MSAGIGRGTLPLVYSDDDIVIRLTEARNGEPRRIRIANGSLVDLALTLAVDGLIDIELAHRYPNGLQVDMPHWSGTYRLDGAGVLPRQEFARLTQIEGGAAVSAAVTVPPSPSESGGSREGSRLRSPQSRAAASTRPPIGGCRPHQSTES